MRRKGDDDSTYKHTSDACGNFRPIAGLIG